jgi:hypothetical protein
MVPTVDMEDVKKGKGAETVKADRDKTSSGGTSRRITCTI